MKENYFMENFIDEPTFYENGAVAEGQTRDRLKELQSLGCSIVGYGQFGIKDVFSGLYIEQVWSNTPEDWAKYIAWVKSIARKTPKFEIEIFDLSKGEKPETNETVYVYDEYNHQWEQAQFYNPLPSVRNDCYFCQGLVVLSKAQYYRWARLPKLNPIRDLVGYEIGDFIEFFGDYAKVAAEIFQLTLTTAARGRYAGKEMAGIPKHSRWIYEQIAERHNYLISVNHYNPETI